MTDMPWTDFPDDDSSPSDIGADYIPPADRVPEWAEMAASFARDGFGADEIAEALCVDEATVARLLKLAGSTT
jgi:hypothetical protein